MGGARTLRRVLRRLRESDGQTLLEYGLVLTFISTTAIGLASLGDLGEVVAGWVDAVLGALP